MDGYRARKWKTEKDAAEIYVVSSPKRPRVVVYRLYVTAVVLAIAYTLLCAMIAVSDNQFPNEGMMVGAALVALLAIGRAWIRWLFGSR